MPPKPESMDAVAPPVPGEVPPPLLLRLPLPVSEVALPDVEGWADVAGDAGVEFPPSGGG